MFSSSSEPSNKRIKVVGAVLTAALLLIAGAVVMKDNFGAQNNVPMEHIEAITKATAVSTPFSQLPEESSLETPHGWVVESDEAVEGAETQDLEDGSDDGLEQEEAESDDDIDSSMDVEEDENGEKFVAEFDSDVMVTGDEADGELAVQEDGKLIAKRRCYKNLKACGARKACSKKCIKKCKPKAVRKCAYKKFCRCYCKYYGKMKQAKKCVNYKRKTCKTATIYACKRSCKKFCKRIPRCYCCPKSKIAKRCYRSCKKYMYTAKCGYCRCKLTRCVRTCKFVCNHKYY